MKKNKEGEIKMNYLLDVIACSLLVIIKFLTIIVISAFIQLIVYQLTGFSIYNRINKLFMKEVRNYGIYS